MSRILSKIIIGRIQKAYEKHILVSLNLDSEKIDLQRWYLHYEEYY